MSNRPDDGPGSGRIYYGWWVVLASALGAGVSHSSVALLSFGVLLKPLSGEFGWDRAQVSLAVSLATLVIALGTPALGRLVDRVGERRVLFPAMALYAVFFGALSQLTGSLWQFYALFILAAIAGIGSNSVVYTRAITSWFDRRRGLALGLAMAGVGLAAAAIPSLTQLLIDRFGWRGAYIGFGLIVLTCLPIVAFLMRRPPSVERSSRAAPIDATSQALQGQDGLSVAAAMRTRVFWTLGCSFALAAIAIHGCTVHLIPLLTDRGISPRSAAGAMSLFGLGMLAGRIAAGYLMDRLFAPRVAAAFFAGPLLGIGLLLAETSQDLAALSALLLGVGAGAEVDVIALLTSRYFGLRHFGEIYGYFYSVFMLGTGIGPLLVGVGFEATGSYRVPLWTALGAISVLCVLLLSLGSYPERSRAGYRPSRRGASSGTA